MLNILKVVDGALNVSQWKFFANCPQDIPQQDNTWDCGAFVCAYARHLVTKGIVIAQSSIPDYRKYMILELHERVLLPLPPEDIKEEHYYAVDYVNKYYIGRALTSNISQFVSFKFMHRIGACKFDWPKRNDEALNHVGCVFYGPIMLQGIGPFEIAELQELDAVFQATRRRIGGKASRC